MKIDKFLKKNTPRCNWINIVGIGKRRKTLTAIEIAKECDSLYIDCEDGTAPYDITAAYIETIEEFNAVMSSIEQDGKIYDIIVCEPIDTLAKFIQTGILAYNNQSDLKDVKKPGIGNGWNIMYESFISKINIMIKHSKLLLTITHLKLNVISKDLETQITSADFNLIGQLKAYVNDKADAHVIFETKVSSEGKSFISVGTSSETHATTFGSRGGILSELFNVKTPEELKTFILKTVKGEVNED